MIISVFTTIALILQIGAFVVHVHSIDTKNETLSFTNTPSSYTHHCEICDATLKISHEDIAIVSLVNSESILPYYKSPSQSINFLTVERATSRAPPLA